MRSFDPETMNSLVPQALLMFVTLLGRTLLPCNLDLPLRLGGRGSP